jgi:NADH-quinone oxidoreductase subunit K
MMIVPLTHILALAGALLFLGVWCTVTRRNLIMILLGIEIMLSAAALAFVGASLYWQQIEGQAVALFILAIAAAEVSVGLALIVCVYRRNLTLNPMEGEGV